MKKILLMTFLGLFLVVGTATAQVIPTVRSTSSIARVGEVQAILNACIGTNLTVDGLYGPRTTSAVRTFQRDYKLSIDGIIGRNTASALNDCWDGISEPATPVTPTQTLCPNGTTLASNCTMFPNAPIVPLCPNGMTLASNCMVAPGATTVPLCPNGMTLASNCSQSPNTTTPPVFSGTEGNLTNVNKLGLYNNTKVNEGEKDARVYAIEMTAKDGDQKINGFNVAFHNNGGGSNRFTRVASEVSIWLDGVEIGRKISTQYSDDSSNIYTYRFSGMNGIVKMNQKSTLVVAVSAVSTFDSADVVTDSWFVGAGTSPAASNSNFVSAASANGRYRDFGSVPASSNSVVDFQKATSEATWKVSASSTNPVARVVQISKTAPTSEVVLLSFDAKAENAAMLLQKLPIGITVSNTGSPAITSAQTVLTNVKLYVDGQLVTSESAPPVLSGTVTFGNSSKLSKAIGTNSTVKVEIRADISSRGVTPTYGEGTTIIANYGFDPTGCTGTTLPYPGCTGVGTGATTLLVELDNSNRDKITNYTGSASGTLQTLRSTGVQVSMGNATQIQTADNNGAVVTRTYSIPVSIKALDNTIYVNKSSSAGENALTVTAGVTKAIAYIIDGTTATPSATWVSNDAVEVGNGFEIPSGATRNFTLTVLVNGTTGTAARQIRVQLNQVRISETPDLLNSFTQDLTPVNSFRTGFGVLNNAS